MKNSRDALNISPEERSALKNSGMVDFTWDVAGLEPFSQIGDRLILLPEGGASSGRWAMARFIERMLLAEKDADEIISLAVNQIAQNSYQTAEISPVQGIEVATRYSLTSGGYIIPLHGDSSEMILGRWAADEFWECGWRGNSAALVLPITVDPAFVDGNADHTACQSDPAAATERRLYRRIIECALSLNTPNPVSIIGWCSVHNPESIYDTGLRSSPTNRYIKPLVMPKPIDMRAVDETILDIKRFPKAGLDKFLLAAERLVRSRANIAIADQALDLGMAQEIALMGADGDGTSEITSRIGLRCGWLLGTDAVSRRTYAKQASTLYSLRSAAAHTGTISSTKLKSLKIKDIDKSLSDSDALIVKILLEILKQKCFPDWNDLVFGHIAL